MMIALVNWVQMIMILLGGYLGWFMGGVDGFMYALISMVLLDYLTGVMCAILEKRLSSSIGYRGIFKKISIFIMVATAHIIDEQIIGDGSVLRTAVIFFYCANEGISLLENASKMGLPIPEKIKDVLSKLKEQGGNQND